MKKIHKSTKRHKRIETQIREEEEEEEEEEAEEEEEEEDPIR